MMVLPSWTAYESLLQMRGRTADWDAARWQTLGTVVWWSPSELRALLERVEAHAESVRRLHDELHHTQPWFEPLHRVTVELDWQEGRPWPRSEGLGVMGALLCSPPVVEMALSTAASCLETLPPLVEGCGGLRSVPQASVHADLETLRTLKTLARRALDALETVESWPVSDDAHRLLEHRRQWLRAFLQAEVERWGRRLAEAPEQPLQLLV